MPITNTTDTPAEYGLSLPPPEVEPGGVVLAGPGVRLARSGLGLAALGVVFLFLAAGRGWGLPLHLSGAALGLGGCAIAFYGLSWTERVRHERLPGERYPLPEHSADPAPRRFTPGTVVTFFEPGGDTVLACSAPIMVARSEVKLARGGGEDPVPLEVEVLALP